MSPPPGFTPATDRGATRLTADSRETPWQGFGAVGYPVNTEAALPYQTDRFAPPMTLRPQGLQPPWLPSGAPQQYAQEKRLVASHHRTRSRWDAFVDALEDFDFLTAILAILFALAFAIFTPLGMFPQMAFHAFGLTLALGGMVQLYMAYNTTATEAKWRAVIGFCAFALGVVMVLVL